MLLIAFAMVLYALTALAGGSGFLAVFVAGLVLGDAELPEKLETERFNRSLAGLAEIVVFVALGLTVDVLAAARQRVARRRGADGDPGDRGAPAGGGRRRWSARGCVQATAPSSRGAG